jgi:parvulin-like peptidyl-prolyl isomerase
MKPSPTTMASLLLVCFAAGAHAQVIERVVATVDDEPIFLSELRGRAAPFHVCTRLDAFCRQVLDAMVDDRLVEQAGAMMHVAVERHEVDRVIDGIRTRAGVDEPRFWEAVRGQGFTAAGYREQLRKQLLRSRVIRAMGRTDPTITEDDVRQRYARLSRDGHGEATVEHIFFELSPHADVRFRSRSGEAWRRQSRLGLGASPRPRYRERPGEHGAGHDQSADPRCTWILHFAGTPS